MKKTALALSLLSCCVLAGAPTDAGPAALTLDGKLNDPFWQSAPPHSLLPSEAGVPARLGGEVRVKRRGKHLCLAALLPEPGGKVLARSIGRNPVWEKDVLTSPELEDRIVYTLLYRSSTGAARNLTIAINPWGAYRVEDGGQVVRTAEILRAADLNPQGWTVEAAVPATLLDLDWTSNPAIGLRAERIRSRRALSPEYRWAWPGGEPATVALTAGTNDAAASTAPEVRPPAFGNTEPPLEVGRVLRVPPAVAKWDDAAWSRVPEFLLTRNEPSPRAARHPTRVKWMHDGRSLALFFYVEEPEPLVARAGGRDSAVTGEDHVAVYLATSGSAFLEIAVNSAGAVLDSLGAGPRSMRPNTGWNASVEVQTDIRRGHWIARINIPLDQCAAALGEAGVPTEWRILLSRHRAARPGEAAESSTMPVLEGAPRFYGPARYRRLLLRSQTPAEVKLPPPVSGPQPSSALAAGLAKLPSNVWSLLERRHRGVRTMVDRHTQRRIEAAVLAERKAWDNVKTRQDWERFRDERMRGLKESLGAFPPARPPLDVRVSARHRGDRYRLENVVFQSRPGFYVTANLYLPERTSGPSPAIILVHSQHYPKTEWELHDAGETWARAGSAVLIVERPGYGERAETNPWFRQAYASRATFPKQLFPIGESYSAWAAWDVIRSTDFLLERPEIDPGKIIVIGSVASGGEVAALAGALDPRIAAVIPYNYDQGHLRVHGDSPGQIARQFSPWLVAASIAPRKFVRPFEFAWEGSEETDIPGLWVDGMSRSEKVWGFYNARDSLAEVQGFGLLRVRDERRSPCENVGPEQRETLYPLLERWFGIPWPSAKDRAIPPVSVLSTHSDREAARRHEAQRLRPHADLQSITPALAAELPRKAMHRIAWEIGEGLLREARARTQSLDARQRARTLRDELRTMLGDIEPTASPRVETLWKRSLPGARVEAMTLAVEAGIEVPLLLLLPEANRPRGVVVGIAQGGKDRFLTGRANELAVLLGAGLAVCLPDLRGTGETEFDPRDYPYGGLVQQQFDLSGNLLGSRLKDLRTVLASLRGRSDLDGKKVAVWGESFAPPNPANLYLDEVEFEAGPQIQRYADPLGAHLALLAGLYEDEVRAVAARGGLAGYLSLLESPYVYAPMDVIILGVLKSGDIADIAGALAPRPVALAGMVGGRNIRPSSTDLEAALKPARQAYRAAGAAQQVTVGDEPRDMAAWLIGKLK